MVPTIAHDHGPGGIGGRAYNRRGWGGDVFPKRCKHHPSKHTPHTPNAELDNCRRDQIRLDLLYSPYRGGASVANFARVAILEDCSRSIAHMWRSSARGIPNSTNSPKGQRIMHARTLTSIVDCAIHIAAW